MFQTSRFVHAWKKQYDGTDVRFSAFHGPHSARVNITSLFNTGLSIYFSTNLNPVWICPPVRSYWLKASVHWLTWLILSTNNSLMHLFLLISLWWNINYWKWTLLQVKDAYLQFMLHCYIDADAEMKDVDNLDFIERILKNIRCDIEMFIGSLLQVFVFSFYFVFCDFQDSALQCSIMSWLWLEQLKSELLNIL